ncbi:MULTISPECIES: FadR/GntR family transcriptional regulator [Leucobacter]|uniref:FadR/GntR family transcriptional regulator n=1 Tax=Leucobacter TaxID=55968 RepID=UPI000E65AEBB|nr:FadR/GntR family transcriptional regulator [Leucobacter aridicollis]UTX53152.1 FadR family transcriptional regulator [Leucobacter aridicollis]
MIALSDPVFPAVGDARRTSVADIVQHVVQSTVSLGMKPGDKLPPERRLVELLGVGRSPLREALKCLDIIGFIDIRPGDGTYLSTAPSSILPQVVSWGVLLGTREADELIEARYYTEVALAGLAAERRSDADLTELEGLLVRMESAENPEAFASADNAFHLAIARAAANSALSAILLNIKSLLAVWVVRVVERAQGNDALIAQHRAVFEAIRAGDAQAAGETMGAHIHEVTDMLRATLGDAAA